MKPLAFLCTVLLCLSMAACSADTPPATSTTTVPSTAADPTIKTIYVHTAVTTASDAMDARTEYIYDEFNNLSEVIQYSGTAQTRRYSVICDQDGNFIEWNTTVGALQLSILYDYDDQGNKLGSAQYHNGELMSQTIYTIENGLRTAVVNVMPAQNQETRTQYIYNSQGVRVREDYLINNMLQRYGVYTTDEQGRVVSIHYYLADGTPHSSVSYTYDGLQETQTLKDPAGNILQKDVITYDTHGNVNTTHRYDSQDKLIATKTETWMAITIPFDCPRKSDSALA